MPLTVTTTEATNAKLGKACQAIRELITLAGADAKHAQAHMAFDTARNDRHRAALLHQALTMLEACQR